MMDDQDSRQDRVREHHGCTCTKGDVKLVEVSTGIEINTGFGAVIKPAEARYLARKLYHLAQKIERREQECAQGDAP